MSARVTTSVHLTSILLYPDLLFLFYKKQFKFSDFNLVILFVCWNIFFGHTYSVHYNWLPFQSEDIMERLVYEKTIFFSYNLYTVVCVVCFSIAVLLSSTFHMQFRRYIILLTND